MKKQNEIYNKEFQLNLEHQVENLKQPMYVGYQIDNVLLFTIIIPRIRWIGKWTTPNYPEKKKW